MPSKINKSHKSEKHKLIENSNTKVLLAVAIATFVVVFSIFASKTLISQSAYQNKVISKKETALKKMKENMESLTTLKATYDSFQAESLNILGGNPSGTGPIDGSNAKIVLDALPDKYDFPAISTSFSNLFSVGGYDTGPIGGSEDTALASNNTPTANVTPVSVPYSFNVTSSLDGTRKLFDLLDRTIRPIYVDTIKFQIADGVVETSVEMHTFFTQPKTFIVGSEEVK
jgi:hypothetical protein